MIEMQPQQVNLSTMFHGRLFRIPQYQRAYSWRAEHRKALFEDIGRTWAAGKDNSHFMAMIVGLRREKRTIITDDHQVIEVVDGQQRITTLILLLKAIAKALKRSEAIEERIGRELDEILVKPDKASLLLLQTNHDSSHYFADYLRTGNHPPSESAKTLAVADHELLLAMEDCEQFVANWQDNGNSLADLVGLLKNRLTFVFYEIGDEALVYTVFEVLNSRGLEVSWFDRLKSMLMAIVFETDTGNKSEIIDEVHQLWTDIYRCVGSRLEMSIEVFRFAATLRLEDCPNRVLGEKGAADLLRDQSKEGPAKVVETTRWLKAVTEAVDRLTADKRRNAVTQIAQARLVATAVYLRSDLTESEKSEVLHRWENVTFRIYGMLDNDARKSVGNYVRLAWPIIGKRLSAKQILEDLSTIGTDFPIGDAIKKMRKADCYNYWQEELRYFFYRYEEHLAQKAGQKFNNEQWNRIWLSSAADSIEHILPQSAGGDSIHRLGNLLVLPPKLNSKLQDRTPSKKADEYNKTGLLVVQEVVDQLPGWGTKAIEEREDTLLQWAFHEWAD